MVSTNTELNMNKQKLFKIYDKINASLGFANVNCLKMKCDFCETGIGHAFLFPFEDEYLEIKNNIKIPFEEKIVNGVSIKTLGICNSSCGFYKNRKCDIQKYKPIECKLYPYLVWEGYKLVNLKLDLRCPEAVKLRKNIKYLQQIVPHLKDLINNLPKEYFIARGSLPNGMGNGAKPIKITELGKL